MSRSYREVGNTMEQPTTEFKSVRLKKVCKLLPKNQMQHHLLTLTGQY